MTDPDEIASLVDQITRGYREHAAEGAEVVAVPGRVLGADIEGQVDALAEAAARLAELLAAFTQEPQRSMDAIAVFRGLSRAAAALGIRRCRAAAPGMVRPRRRGGSGGLGRVDDGPRWAACRRAHV